MPDFLQRQWILLSLLPRAPRTIDAALLEAKLREHGIDVNRRSVQRDLVALSTMFPLACDERSKPYGWSWAEDAFGMDVPGGMSPHAALAFKLAADMLGGVMPRATLSFLKSHMKSAERVLEGTDPLASWPTKVRVIPPITAGVQRDVPPSVLDAIMTALLEDRRFAATVKDGSPRATHAVDPLGLIFRDGTAWLVCRFDGGQAKQVRLSTFSNARVMDVPRTVPARFDLDAFVSGGKRKARAPTKRGRSGR